jgi:excinuclease UvrABC helicase subunit UvrB
MRSHVLAQMADYGASRKPSEARFRGHLADGGNNLDSVCRNIDFLFHPVDLASFDRLSDDHISVSSDPDSHSSLLTSDQHSVVSKIIEAVLHETHQLMFLQGPCGTGKSFTIEDLINAFHSHHRKRLICGTAGIAAV